MGQEAARAFTILQESAAGDAGVHDMMRLVVPSPDPLPAVIRYPVPRHWRRQQRFFWIRASFRYLPALIMGNFAAKIS